MSEIEIDRPLPKVLRLRLNRPEAMNAFTFGMYETLLQQLHQLRHDTDTQVVILTGTGRAFCTGHDLRQTGSAPWVAPELGFMQHRREFMSELAQIPLAMRRLSQPVICAVNGVAAGLGFVLSLAADLTLAARSAKFVNAIHNAGTGAEAGLSYLLPRVIGAQRAAELLYTARPVLADEAERIGLILRQVDDVSLEAESLELAQRIAVNVPIGIAMTKQSLHLNQNAGSLEAAIELEHRAVLISQSTADATEKMQAFFDKRAPNFTQR